MDNEELKKVLENPKRMLNIVRVFHQLLHQYDKMEEEKAKNNPGVQRTQMKDKLEIVCKDKNGKIKAHIQS